MPISYFGYHEAILIVNLVCILFLLLLGSSLLYITKFKRANGYAAAIITFTTIPAYLYNMSRSEQWFDIAVWFAPLGFSVNTLLMPLLWMFVHKSFDTGYKFSMKQTLHFLPSLICILSLICYLLSVNSAERYDFMIHENTGTDTWLGNINSAIVFVQMFVYYTFIFAYLFRVKKYLLENRSDMEWAQKSWIPKFIVFSAVLFVAVVVAYCLWPRTDAWLI